MSFFKVLWKNQGKHTKLGDEWELAKSQESDVDIIDETEESSIFKVKYLGKTAVITPTNEQTTSKAINTILAMAKLNHKKNQKINVSVTRKGIEAMDSSFNETIFDISIYRISNCSADASRSRIFTFLATNNFDTTECYAFLCSKKGTAEQMAITVAKCFNTVYEAWRENQFYTSKFINDNKSSEDFHFNNINRSLTVGSNGKVSSTQQSGGEDNIWSIVGLNQNGKVNGWVSFESEQDDFLRRVSYKPVASCSSQTHAVNNNFFNDCEWNDRLITL